MKKTIYKVFLTIAFPIAYILLYLDHKLGPPDDYPMPSLKEAWRIYVGDITK